jgi:hypothetical protein
MALQNLLNTKRAVVLITRGKHDSHAVSACTGPRQQPSQHMGANTTTFVRANERGADALGRMIRLSTAH